MASYWLHQNETKINLPGVEEQNAITFYKIEVTVGNVQWTVFHRYSEFYELNSQLVVDHGVAKDLLPPKKVIRNKCPVFIATRRQALEGYLQYLLNYLKRTMPRIFIEFLNFHLYDTFYLLQSLALQLYKDADKILISNTPFGINPLQLHAISECIKTPFPETAPTEKCYDISHVLDFCSQLKVLEIHGECTPHKDSNIIPNKLLIELSSFKALETLVVTGLGLENVHSLGNLRNTIRSLCVQKTDVRNISQILQCDILHKSAIFENKQVWMALTKMDLSSNMLTSIDETIMLIPNIETLILNENKISSIANLASLTNLKHLFLSNNLISSCDSLHTKLGNILTLDLSQNAIKTLQGMSKLYSLETLDLNSNKIVDVNGIACIGDLPCIENLVLTGNSVATIIDYRIKVLETFGERAKDICLDNEKPSQPELDKVIVLRALRIVREGRTPDFNTSFS